MSRRGSSVKNRAAKELKGVIIDPLASVHPTAEFESGVRIGPYSVIGENVRIGRDTQIASHVVIGPWTTIGRECNVFQFASVGAPPQDLGYKGEKTEVILGDNNVIREFVTIHRATTKAARKTVCGNNNLFMNYVHVAHDCMLGNDIIMANAATLAGHVTIEDHAIVGGIVAVHQFVRIGAYCIIGGLSAVSKDVPPYVLAVGNRARLYGLNKVGLRRKGFSAEDIDEIRHAYKIIFLSSLGIKEAKERLRLDMPGSEHAQKFLEFIERSKRGITRARLKGKGVQHDEDD